ncbi:MAG: hypothetical protein NC123_19150 [Butyrivibrio sp.]|nr:hypothetical protein [Butyrivibrio sp.]
MAKKMVSFFPKRYGFLKNMHYGEENGIIFPGLSSIMMKKDRKADWQRTASFYVLLQKRDHSALELQG